MRVVFEPLPVWRDGLLAAEYDAAGDVVRVNSIAIERVRASLGDEAARRFVTCAIAHEGYHRAHPHGTEAQAHRHARAVCGEDPERFSAVLRD